MSAYEKGYRASKSLATFNIRGTLLNMLGYFNGFKARALNSHRTGVKRRK